MRLRRLMGVADQIIAYRFSSIDLSNKARFSSYRLLTPLAEINAIIFLALIISPSLKLKCPLELF